MGSAGVLIVGPHLFVSRCSGSSAARSWSAVTTRTLLSVIGSAGSKFGSGIGGPPRRYERQWLDGSGGWGGRARGVVADVEAPSLLLLGSHRSAASDSVT